MFRVGAGLAVVATATPLLTLALAQAEGAHQAGAEPLNRNGFYRFKIGDFQATVISDGYGQLPIGIVTSLSHAGENITGVVTDAGIEVWEKHFEFLRQVNPTTSRVAVLFPRTVWKALSAPQKWVKTQYRSLHRGREYRSSGGLVDSPYGEAEYGRVFETINQQRAGASVVFDSMENFYNRRTVVALAERGRLPAIYPYRAFVEQGRLMAYTIDLKELGRQAVSLVDKIIKGANPADIPFQQRTTFELVNLKTAKALGLSVPPSLLALANNKVIE